MNEVKEHKKQWWNMNSDDIERIKGNLNLTDAIWCPSAELENYLYTVFDFNYPSFNSLWFILKNYQIRRYIIKDILLSEIIDFFCNNMREYKWEFISWY